MSYVYFLEAVDQSGPIKIGQSIAPVYRLRQYMGWSPVPLQIITMINLPLISGKDKPMQWERRFHEKYLAVHSHQEWFNRCDVLLTDIDKIIDGTFDLESLPPLSLSTAQDGNIGEKRRIERAALRNEAIDRSRVLLDFAALEEKADRLEKAGLQFHGGEG